MRGHGKKRTCVPAWASLIKRAVLNARSKKNRKDLRPPPGGKTLTRVRQPKVGNAPREKGSGGTRKGYDTAGTSRTAFEHKGSKRKRPKRPTGGNWGGGEDGIFRQSSKRCTEEKKPPTTGNENTKREKKNKGEGGWSHKKAGRWGRAVVGEQLRQFLCSKGREKVLMPPLS